VFVRIVVLVLLAVFLWAVFARDTGAGAHPRHHTVRAGETLWAIAVANYAGDPREGVWKLQQRNRLSSSTIRPGQRLVLP
jgi:LysM repeat protein